MKRIEDDVFSGYNTAKPIIKEKTASEDFAEPLLQMETKNKKGYVYILESKNSPCIKIGGTDFPPIKRIKEINKAEPYRSLGIWNLADFRQVRDWRFVEHSLHYRFKSVLNKETAGQKELFYLSVQEASAALNELPEEQIVYKPKVDRFFQDENLLEYVTKLFLFSGLVHRIDSQGVWTLNLFPSTNGGRFFTINIGETETAFSSIPKKDSPQINMLLVDKLILDFPEIKKWLKTRNGFIDTDSYKKALPRACTLFFEGSFREIKELFELGGIRRALIAYWYEAILSLTDKNQLSIYERYHNYNATAKLIRSLNMNRYEV